MAYTIPPSCVHCGECLPKCPTSAIQIDTNHEYWVEPGLCHNCENLDSNPPCVKSCPDNLPLPLPSKKGRYKAEPGLVNTHHLFANGHNNPIASSMVIWEACNLLAKGSIFPWQNDSHQQLYFERSVKQGKGKIEFRLNNDVNNDCFTPVNSEDADSTLKAMDIRAAAIHLIFAALVTNLEQPWKEEFAINHQQIETYLGLDKRKDLSKAAKLTLIKTLVQQPCKLLEHRFSNQKAVLIYCCAI